MLYREIMADCFLILDVVVHEVTTELQTVNYLLSPMYHSFSQALQAHNCIVSASSYGRPHFCA